MKERAIPSKRVRNQKAFSRVSENFGKRFATPLGKTTDNPTVHEGLVTAQEEGLRLQRWLRRRFSFLPYSVVQKCLRQGRLSLDGQIVHENIVLHAGQTVILRDQRAFPCSFSLTFSSKDEDLLRSLILYEDSRCCVLNKPAGLAVQGGSKIHRSVDTLLEAHFCATGDRWCLVHRLDRETSGLLLLAKDRPSAAYWTRLFREQKMQKAYLAITMGFPSPEIGQVIAPLKKKRSGGEERVVVDPEGLHAETAYRVCQKCPPHALLFLQPKTGRTHQLRVHCATILGCPIMGDKKYGDPQRDKNPSLRLHAYQLRAPDLPLLTAPLPETFFEGTLLQNLNNALFSFSVNV
ncbi:MAG: RluA family pseudouridine synthase [Holosporales bacterium]|nr:RluA family pseudouridine synthase [Holosporales bacterium]